MINVPANRLLTLNITAPVGEGAPHFASGLTIDALGRETISGVAIDLTKEPFASQNTGGPLTSITLGTRTVGSDHFIAADASLVTAATTADQTYTWTGCTATNANGTSTPFDLTITTLANQRTWSDPLIFSDEFFFWAERGKTVTLLGGYWVEDPAQPATRLFFKPQSYAVAFDGSNYLVVKPYPGATVTADTWEIGHSANNLGSIKIEGITFVARPSTTSNESCALVADDCLIENCTIAGEEEITGFTNTASPPIRKLLSVGGDRSKAINCQIADGTQCVTTGGEDNVLSDITIRRAATDAFFAGSAHGLRATNIKILEKIILARRTQITAIGIGAQTTITLAAGHPFSTVTTEGGSIHFVTVTGGANFLNRPVDLIWVAGDTYRIVREEDGTDIDTSAAVITDISGAYLYGSPVGEDFIHGDYGQFQSVMVADDQHEGAIFEGWFGGRQGTPADYLPDGQGLAFVRPNLSSDGVNNRMIRDLELRCIMQETAYTWGFNVHNLEHGVISAATYINPAHGKQYDVNQATIATSLEGVTPKPRNLLVYDTVANRFTDAPFGTQYFADENIALAGTKYITLVNCYQVALGAVSFENSDDRFTAMQAIYDPLFAALPAAAILDDDFSGYAAKVGGPLDPVGSGIKIGAIDHWDGAAYINPRTEITLSNIVVTPTATGATITFDTNSVSNGNVIVTVHGSGEEIYNGQVEAGHNLDGSTASVAAQSQAVTAVAQQSVLIAGLTASTNYRVSVIQIGADGYRSKIVNRPSGVPLSSDFTTTA